MTSGPSTAAAPHAPEPAGSAHVLVARGTAADAGPGGVLQRRPACPRELLFLEQEVLGRALGFRPDRHDAWQYGRGRQEGRNWKTHHRSSVGVRSSINVREVSLFTLSGTLVAGVAQAEVLAERLPSRGRIDNGS